MAFLLRTLVLLMVSAIILTALSALGLINLKFSHIEIAIPTMVFLIFVQAFVMFYFIGVARLVENVHHALNSPSNLKELFDEPPKDLTPYHKEVNRFIYSTGLAKRQTIPWTILMLTLGSIGFLLGGAHHTGLVSKIIHSGVIYGFIVAMFIGFSKQWKYLGQSHKTLRQLKHLFQISDDSM